MIKHMRTFGNVSLLIEPRLPGEKRPLAASMTTKKLNRSICVSFSHKHQVPVVPVSVVSLS